MTGPQDAGEYPGYGTPPAHPGQPSQYGQPQYEQPQYQQPQYQQPQYQQPQYQQPQYQQPQYQQPLYQHPYGGHPAHVYPPQPPGASAPRVSLQWTGALMFLGGVLAAIGSFFAWVKGTTTLGSFAINGLGSVSGDEIFKRAAEASVPNVTDGKITLALGILVALGAVVILARQGRVWVGITATVLSAIAMIISLADFGSIDNANKKFPGVKPFSPQIGLVLTLVGAIVALAFSIVAICVRRRKV